MAHGSFGGCDAIVVLSTMLTAMLMKRFRPGLHVACVDAVEDGTMANGEQIVSVHDGERIVSGSGE